MDTGRKRAAQGVTERASVSPFGKSRWLGTVLGILSLFGAVWVVADRVLNRVMLQAGGVELQALYQTLRTLLTSGGGALVLVILLLAAAKCSESLPDQAAFAVLALAEIVQSAGMLGGLLLPQGGVTFYLAAVCVPLSAIMRVAAYLVLFINRENSRDARLASVAAGCVWVIRAIAAVVTYYAAWVLTGTDFSEVWVNVLGSMSRVTLFTAILSGVLGGLAFLFLRTPVPEPIYPEKTEQK